jgi:hypothetical protein
MVKQTIGDPIKFAKATKVYQETTPLLAVSHS